MTALQQRFQKPDEWRWGTIESVSGGMLRYGMMMPENPQAVIVRSQGRSESAEKDFELARDFYNQACGFAVLERKGMGRSAPYQNLKDIFAQHSGPFGEHAEDLIKFRQQIIPRNLPAVIIGNSTGALPALMALHDDNTKSFRAGLMAAPLLGNTHKILKNREDYFAAIPTSPLPHSLLTRYAFGETPWSPRTAEEEAAMSSDPDRGRVHDASQQDDETLRRGGSTFGWVLQACRAVATVRDPRYLAAIIQPLKFYTAGRDVMVDNGKVYKALSGTRALGKKIDHFHYPSGKHELLMEADTIRAPLVADMLAFTKKQAGGPS